MTEPKKESTNTPRDRFQAEFEALPLNKKFESLFKMEAATLSEAFNYVVNEPMKVVEKVGDVINDLGTRIETEVRKAAGKADCDYTPPRAAKAESAKPKAKPQRKPKSPPSPNP